MANLDFSLARKKHMEWRTRLRAFLDGHATLGESEAVSHKDCALGKWLYPEGLAQFGHIPEMKKLEVEHERMHGFVKQVIQLGNAGDRSGAEAAYSQVVELSRGIVDGLNAVELKVKSGARQLPLGLHRVTGFFASIRGKIVGYALLVVAILVAIGVFGFQGTSAVNADVKKMSQQSSLVDAAMEMKLAVGADLTVLMDMIVAANEEELAAAWREHEALIARFDLFGDAILNGADTPEGRIVAARDPELRGVVERADRFHNDEFQPGFKRMHGLRKRQLEMAHQREQRMHQFEGAFDQVIALAEGFEKAVKRVIDRRIAAGASADEILTGENTWADMAMEIKTTLAMSRIFLEEYSQDMEAADRPTVAKEFAGTVEEFDIWIGALLNGARTEEGRIARVDDSGLRAQVERLDQLHNSALQASAKAFMELVDEDARVKSERAKLDQEVDEVGGRMMELIGGVEDGAKKAMRSASDEAIEASHALEAQLLTGLVVGIFVSALFGWLIVRAIVRPLNSAVRVARSLAEGNLDEEVEVTTQDEMGMLLSAMKNMVESLRTIVIEVRESSSGIAGSSREISAGNSDLSQRTEEQASSLEETASSMEELTSTVKQNAENARQANQIATATRDEAEQSGQVVGRAVDAMAGINESSRKIADIIGVVDEIAFQTNLLALNAAVEAARAGEQGRGFAVVAAEVRKLAQRSADSAKEIKELINDSVTRVEEGSSLVDQSGQALDQIVEQVKKVSDIVAEIAAATAEQSSGIEQVNKAIMQMDGVTQQNAAMVEEMAANSKSLEEESATLFELVEFFKIADNR